MLLVDGIARKLPMIMLNFCLYSNGVHHPIPTPSLIYQAFFVLVTQHDPMPPARVMHGDR